MDLLPILIYGVAAVGILVMILRWINGPIGGPPKVDGFKKSGDSIGPVQPWRDQKKM